MQGAELVKLRKLLEDKEEENASLKSDLATARRRASENNALAPLVAQL